MTTAEQWVMPEGSFDALSDLAAHRVGILLARWPDDLVTSFTIAARTTSLSMAFPMASTLCDVASGVSDLDHIASALCKMR